MARPSKRATRRQELVPKIARAFAELGYRRTTTSELARRCAVRENILYRLWADKKAMFIASIEYVYESSAKTWAELSETGQGRGSQAERLLEYEARHHGEFGLYRIIFAGLSEADDPEIREALKATYQRFHHFIRLQIDVHRQSSESKGVPDSELSAWAFLGLGTVANISREFGLLKPFERVRLLNKIGRLLLQGRPE